jgi:hypothetical protein
MLVRVDKLTNEELERLAQEQERKGDQLHADELRRCARLSPEERTRLVESTLMKPRVEARHLDHHGNALWQICSNRLL